MDATVSRETGKEEPQSRPAKTKRAGLIMMALGLATAWFFIVKPVQEGLRTGQLHYYLKGVLLPPALLYAGCAMLVADLRDGQIYSTNEVGKKKLTRKGRLFMVGLCVTLGVAVGAWYACLHALGFEGL
jgi:hypothetical protein